MVLRKHSHCVRTVRFRKATEGFRDAGGSVTLSLQCCPSHGSCRRCAVVQRTPKSKSVSHVLMGMMKGCILHTPRLPQPYKKCMENPVGASPPGTCTHQAGLLLTCKTWVARAQAATATLLLVSIHFWVASSQHSTSGVDLCSQKP